MTFEQLGDSLTLYSHCVDSLEKKYKQAVIQDSLGQKALEKVNGTYDKLTEKAARRVSKRKKERIQDYRDSVLIPAMKEARNLIQNKLDALIAYMEALKKAMQFSEEYEQRVKELEEKEKQIQQKIDDLEERIRQEKSGIHLFDFGNC